MKKLINFFSIVCCVMLLTACGGSSSNGESTTDGILGDLDEYVQDFYAKSDAAAAFEQRVYQNEGDRDKAKGRELRDDLLTACKRLTGVIDKAIGREVPTELRNGTPLKLVKPFTLQTVEFYGYNDGKPKLLDEDDEDQRWIASNHLQNTYLIVSLKAEVELTEDVKAQPEKWILARTVRTFDNLIEFCTATADDSIMVCGKVSTDFDYGVNQPAGTRLTITIYLRDDVRRSFNHPAEEFVHINNINKAQKIIVNWGATTSAVLSEDGVKGELGLFELQGPVKKCTVINDWGNVERTFDEQGFWQTHDGKKLSEVYPGGIERDEYGRIIKGLTDSEGNGEDYTYNKFGKVVKYNCHIYDSIEEDLYTYDDNGNLLKKHIEIGGLDAEEPYDETYTDVVTDEQGNWTSRKANGEVQKREIEYY